MCRTMSRVATGVNYIYLPTCSISSLPATIPSSIMRDATPEDYNNEELYTEMEKKYIVVSCLLAAWVTLCQVCYIAMEPHSLNIMMQV